jgi:chromosome partitioning protein
LRRIAIINQKGGSGKTTTSVSLGAALAEIGKRVLLVDLDAQHSCSLWIGSHEIGRGVFDIFAEPEKTKLKSLVHPTKTENLFLVGSSSWLTGAEKVLANELGAETILRDKLKEIEGEFDYILIDCSPTLGILTVNALTAVDEVLVPVEAHVMGLQGLAQLLQTVEVVKKRINPDLRIAGILACRLDQRTNHGLEILAKLRARFPETFKSTIRENIRLAECPSMGHPITSYSPNSSGAEDYRELAKELISQEIFERRNNVKVANS